MAQTGHDDSDAGRIEPVLFGPHVLPSDRVPTFADLENAGRRWAAAVPIRRQGDLGISLYRFLRAADPDHDEYDEQQIAEVLAATNLNLVASTALVRKALEVGSSADDPLFEDLGAGRWRRRDVPDVTDEVNVAHMIRGAACDGWDVIAPGDGWDCSLSKPMTVPALIVVSGPDGPLDEAVRVDADGTNSVDDQPMSEFLYLFDPVNERDGIMEEVGFRLSEGEDHGTFQSFLSLPDADWGFPDFREITHGWVAYGHGEVVVAWTRPGDAESGCTHGVFEDEDESRVATQRVLLALARATVRAERGELGKPGDVPPR